MSSKNKLFKGGLLCLALGLGSLIGVPILPEQIEELMQQIHKPRWRTS